VREAYPLHTIHFDLVVVLVVVLVVLVVVLVAGHGVLVDLTNLLARVLILGVVLVLTLVLVLALVLLHQVMVLVALTRLVVKMMVAREADRRLMRP
jgi:hypothetical protein